MDELVRRAQRGDAAAMDALVRELSPYVGRICGAIALEDGDDAMQETFIAVLRNLKSLREPAAVKGWVRRIAVRESVRAAGRRAPVQPDEVLAAFPSPVPDLDTAVDIEATLARLHPWQRAVLVLRDIDGLSEVEAAEVLALPTGTVKSRLHRARSAFAERWSA